MGKEAKPVLGASWASSEAARRTMQSNRGRDTLPELALRHELHRLGLRYRVNLRVEPSLRRTVDIAFTRLKLAIFVDGCFWHGCADHGTRPKTNDDYWNLKFQATKRRDADTNASLAQCGWIVLRFWEHEDPVEAARKIVEVVTRLRRAAD